MNPPHYALHDTGVVTLCHIPIIIIIILIIVPLVESERINLVLDEGRGR